ncbi:MAG: hypothetical protein ABEJ60_01350 [Halodesulfurarchaeum sp.]
MRVAIVGPAERVPDGLAGRVPDAVTLAHQRVQDPADLDPAADFAAPVGEHALLSLVRGGFDSPVLPVDVEAGVQSVPRDALGSAIAALEAGAFEIESVPTIAASLGSNSYRALMDAMAVTAEPARISEYRTRKPETGTVVDQVRADGVVAAGPAGTPGYATAAGGPILDPELGGLAVIPVGPFRTERPQWVLMPPIEIVVAREEVPVSLVVDDRPTERIPAGESVRLEWGRPLAIAVVDGSVPALAANGAAETP